MRIHRLAGSAVLIAAASASAQSAPPSAPPKPAPVTQAPAPAAPKPAAPVLAASVARASTADSWNHALQQWHDGKYVDAIDALANVLRATDGDAYLERVALLTGEFYKTVEVAQNGRAPRWSPKGEYLAFEVGTGAARGTKVVAAATRKPVAEVKGWGLVFAADGHTVAYLAPRDSSARNAAIVVRDLIAGTERTLDDGGLVKQSLQFRPGAGEMSAAIVFTLAAKPGDTRTDIYGIPTNGPVGAAPIVPVGDSLKSDFALLPHGEYLWANGGRSPLAQGRAGGPGAARSQSFTVYDPISAARRDYRGDSWTVAADGSTVAWINRDGGRFSLMAAALPAGEPKALVTTADSLAAPALSADGATIAFQMMPDHDWEIYTVKRDGAAPVRVTREIQHDVLPRFIGPDRLLALIGEPRHRRSYLYDLKTLARTRLFHNNTVRTIAPEYEWAASPDGSTVAIVAERDGDTVTPHRHLYLTDLSTTLGKADILARLAAMRDAESVLRAEGTRAFSPIAGDVRQVVAQVSTGRIFEYEKALFDFDSKHVTKPGNAKARQYLLDAYKSFGYDNAQAQPFEARAQGPQAAQAAGVPTANIVATLKGTENPELVYVISSHFDSRAEGPGADDDASGTAALLETARVLAKHPLPATVIFASMTGEESGLLGSREFVRRVKDSLKVVGVLNNDMIGWANDDRLDNTIRYSNPGIRDIQHAAAMQFTNLITYDAYYYKSTDAASFYDVYGDIVGGIGSYPVLGNPHYHMPHDFLEYENHQLIAETAKTTVASIMRIASSPSRLTGLAVKTTPEGAEVSWNKSPEKGVDRYRLRFRTSATAPWVELSVQSPLAVIRSATKGAVIEVKAVNRRGLDGWDWARVTVP